MTILLWITLILAAAAMIILSSPIRFGASGSFGKSKRASTVFWVSYIHPALFIYEYSSAEHNARARFFGIDREKFRRKKSGRKDAEGGDYADTMTTPDSRRDNTGTTATASDSRADNTDATTAAPESRAGDGDTFMTKIRRRADKIQNNSLYAKAKGKPGGGGFYRYLKDRVFRKKFLKWLKRTWGCAITIARFDRLKLHAAAGFADPADTGRMYGYFIAAKNALAPRSKAVIMEMEPVFTEQRMEADIELAGSTSAAIIISKLLAIAAAFPYWRMRKLMKTGPVR